MTNHFQIETMFDGQVHERQKFKVSIQGDEFNGIYHEGAVQWFNPQPRDNISDEQVDHIESSLHELFLQQMNHK